MILLSSSIIRFKLRLIVILQLNIIYYEHHGVSPSVDLMLHMFDHETYLSNLVNKNYNKKKQLIRR
jgi:hypothetical protein